MIESLIIDKLLMNSEIKNYADDRLFVSYAPDGTETPYIVVEADDNYDESGILSVFGITINVYHNNGDARPLREVTQKIVKVLHHEMLNGDGYSAVRLYFTGRTPLMKDSESDLFRVILQFDARACNDYLVN